MNLVLASFLAILLVITTVGVLSSTRSRGTTEDYLVASRSVGPWLSALSSVATNNSGFMFVGLIGFTYRDGLHTIWMAIAWVLGDLLVWLFVHARVREVSGQHRSTSVASLIGTGVDGVIQRPLVIVAALLTLVFLGGYAGAQLQAGGTALNATFGWPTSSGALLGAILVVVYCFSGGLRASIWTDAAQSIVMLGSMVMLLGAAILKVGGPSALVQRLGEIDPALVELWPADPALGLPLYLLGFLAGGFGAIGQPHILVRSMAIRSVSDIGRARVLYFAWFVPFYAAAVAVALYARVLLPDLAGAVGIEATEGALPRLSHELLPQVLVGLMLAGLFSATLSTADSQILSCSAAVTQDMVPRWSESTVVSKLATSGVGAFALLVAVTADDGVFALVLGAWSALGASLGPIVVLRVWRQPVPTALGLVMMGSGWLTTALWESGPLSGDVYSLLPGLLVPFGLYGTWRLAGVRGRQRELV